MQTVAGQRRDGTMVDAARGGTLTYARPEPPPAWYGGSRWLQYYLRLWEEARKPRLQQVSAATLCSIGYSPVYPDIASPGCSYGRAWQSRCSLHTHCTCTAHELHMHCTCTAQI